MGIKGPTSDISLFREQQKKFEADQMFEGDKADQGGENITTPHKKHGIICGRSTPPQKFPRKGELTANQKAENKEFSSKRIFVEHVIRLVKIFQIARQWFPLNSQTYCIGSSHHLWIG